MPLKDDSKTSTRTISENASIVRTLFDLFSFHSPSSIAPASIFSTTQAHHIPRIAPKWLNRLFLGFPRIDLFPSYFQRFVSLSIYLLVSLHSCLSLSMNSTNRNLNCFTRQWTFEFINARNVLSLILSFEWNRKELFWVKSPIRLCKSKNLNNKGAKECRNELHM